MEDTGHPTSLLAQVVDQMTKDAEMGDYTAIEELLQDIPAERLQGFLSQVDENDTMTNELADVKRLAGL